MTNQVLNNFIMGYNVNDMNIGEMRDKFGPEYIIEIQDPKINMEGFLIIDNTALGLGKGGLRMTPQISKEEIWRLARTMTWKNALAELPFGGAKAGIKWPGGSENLKKEFIQSFARAIKIFTPKKYITAPDVNVGEKEMNWFVRASGNWKTATGKPANACMKIFGEAGEICGIPHEFGSTGFGVAQATKSAVDFLEIKLKDCTVAIAGFGNVGSFAFKYLEEMGARIIAVSDISGTVFNKSGLNFKKLSELKNRGKQITDYKEAEKLKIDEIYKLPVDILIPAAVSDVIDENNVNKIKAKIIVEAANIPMQEKQEQILHQKGILIVPDIIANAGGVISSFAEYRGYNPKRMFETIKRKVTKNTKLILEESKRKNLLPRKKALEIAKERVLKAMEERKKTFL